MFIPTGMKIRELDNWIKQNKGFVWFGLYELDKNIHNNILCYFTSGKTLTFEYDGWVTIHLIRSSFSKKPFNQQQAFLENINLFLDNDNANLDWVKQLVSSLNIENFKRTTKAWRILRYLQQYVYKTHPIDISGMRNNRDIIVLWDNQLNGGTHNKPFGILDCFFFTKTQFEWKPKYNEELVNKKLKELYVFKDLNQKYFEKEKNSEIDLTNNKSLYYQYISFLNSKASAKIEWYSIDKLDSDFAFEINKRLKQRWGTNLQAVTNIMKGFDLVNRNSYNAHKRLDIKFINKLQANIVQDTWASEREKEEKTLGHFRDFEIWVFDSVSKYPTNIEGILSNRAYVAPKYESVSELMVALINYYNNSLWKIDDYLLSALLKLIFVMIHPYGDGNGRTSRLLFEWSLINSWWIKNVTIFPLSYSINNHKKKYYEALEKTTRSVLRKIDFQENHLTGGFTVSYSSEDIYLNLDLTPFLLFVIELGKLCFVEAMFEYQYFKTRETILQKFNAQAREFSKEEYKNITKVVISQLKYFSWGKKTEKALSFLNEKELQFLKESIFATQNKVNYLNIDGIKEEEQETLDEAIREHIKHF